MADLDDIVSKNTVVEIVHPGTGAKLGINIEILPADAPKMKAKIKSINDHALWKQQKGKPPTSDEIESNSTEIIVTGIAGWSWTGETTFHGEIPSFNEENVRRLLKEKPWIQSQLDDVYGETKRFFKN